MFNRNDHYEQQENDQRLDDTTTKQQENDPQINDDQQARQLVPSDEQASSNREICDFCLYEGEGNFCK